MVHERVRASQDARLVYFDTPDRRNVGLVLGVVLEFPRAFELFWVVHQEPHVDDEVDVT